MSQSPESLMEAAFKLALAARGTTLPNPVVGCLVLDKAGKLVASATTSPTGRPHAERKALDQAGARAQGGTLVVTLEPCIAFPGKKSPPCAAAVILSGVETVLIGSQDPNPQVTGRGIYALRKSGMEVMEIGLGGRIPDFYAGFGHYLSTLRPRVTLKIALSADGFVAASPGTRTNITGSQARVFVHSLRAGSDAVLVGGSTARVDDPELTVRDAQGKSPRRLVLWPSEGLPSNLRVWDGKPATIAYGTIPRPANLPATVSWKTLPSSGAGVDLVALLESLGADGLHDLLVEPGPRLLESFLRTGLWDRIWIVRSPDALGTGVAADPHGLLPIGPVVRSLELGADRAALIERI